MNATPVTRINPPARLPPILVRFLFLTNRDVDFFGRMGLSVEVAISLTRFVIPSGVEVAAAC
jgi:hypothetical protein